MDRRLRFQITLQTIKDYWKVALIVTLIFMLMAAMYCGIYPAYKDIMKQMVASGTFENLPIPGAAQMDSYGGFLNIELYQIFWLLILGMLIGFIAASLISKEIEAKTIDLFMANPISRKQIIIEKYLGLVPLILVVNFATFAVVAGITATIGEQLNFMYLFVTHLVSIPYFLAVLGLGLLISVIIDEKMKASIIMIAIIMGMYVFQTITLLVPDYKAIGYLSLTHYFNPADILLQGSVDINGILVMLYFDKKDIHVT
jgi:ABC-2 type transport system permease protein